MYMFNGYYSSLIVLIPAMIYTMIVQARIHNAFSTYIKIENSKGISGAEAARCMLDANGLQHVQINIDVKRHRDHKRQRFRLRNRAAYERTEVGVLRRGPDRRSENTSRPGENRAEDAEDGFFRNHRRDERKERLPPQPKDPGNRFDRLPDQVQEAAFDVSVRRIRHEVENDRDDKDDSERLLENLPDAVQRHPEHRAPTRLMIRGELHDQAGPLFNRVQRPPEDFRGNENMNEHDRKQQEHNKNTPPAEER